MTRTDLSEIIGTMDAPQLRVVRICIMAERRLRTIYPRDPAQWSALEDAYEWALNAPPAPMIPELIPK